MKFDIGNMVYYKGELFEIAERKRDSTDGQVSYGLWKNNAMALAEVPEEELTFHKQYNFRTLQHFYPQYKLEQRVIVEVCGSFIDAIIIAIDHKPVPIYAVQELNSNICRWVGPEMLRAYSPLELTFKSRPDWIPADVILGMGDVLAWGKGKYPGNDWKTMSPDLHLAAAQRHLLKHAKGDLNDDESGMNHLYHAMVRLAFYTCLVDSSRKAQNK